MIRFLLWLVFLGCAGIGAAWVAEHPGSVTIHWFDYRIDTSFGFLLLLALFAIFLTTSIVLLLRGALHAPRHFATNRRLAHYEQGLKELTWSVASLASSDIASAQAHTRKAEKLLGRTPLTLLLAAQVARNQGDDDKTRTLMEQMLEHKETEYLAARSLSDAAGKQLLFPKALALAERAQAANPKGVDAVVSLQVRLKQWTQALAAIDKAQRSAGRIQSRRWRGIVHVQQAQQWLEANRPDMAVGPARHALKELPGFSPAIVAAARALAGNGQKNKAVRLILREWKQLPQAPLAEALRGILASEPQEKRAKIMNKLTAIHPVPTALDTAWICRGCHRTAAQWEPHCGQCGAFDTLEWREVTL